MVDDKWIAALKRSHRSKVAGVARKKTEAWRDSYVKYPELNSSPRLREPCTYRPKEKT